MVTLFSGRERLVCGRRRVFEIEPTLSKEHQLTAIGAHIWQVFDEKPVRDKAEAIVMTLSLSSCLAGLK